MKKIIQTPSGKLETLMNDAEIQDAAANGNLEARIERLEKIAASKGWIISL